MDKHYFKRQMAELGITSVKEYFKNANFNYVIIEDGEPLVNSEGIPYIFGDEMEVQNNLVEMNAFDETPFGERILKENIYVLTEQDFLDRFCGKEIQCAIMEEDGKIEDLGQEIFDILKNDKRFVSMYDIDKSNSFFDRMHNKILINGFLLTIEKL